MELTFYRAENTQNQEKLNNSDTLPVMSKFRNLPFTAKSFYFGKFV